MKTPAQLTAFIVLLLTSMAVAIDHSKPAGEPYAIAGKRIAFTNWYFVRPGHPDWLDENGKSVAASKKFKAGPNDAHFTAYDPPIGIRLIAEPAQTVGPVIARDKPWEKTACT